MSVKCITETASEEEEYQDRQEEQQLRVNARM
jgi:hypothetical protein